MPTSMVQASRHPLPLRHLLDPYTTSHPLRSPSPLPPTSRVDPSLTQRLPPIANPLFWSLPTWITFIRFVLAKCFHVVWRLISHFLWGPARKSWGYRMTFITSFMRNVADHSSLADIVLIRRLISLHFLLPLPADAVVTPITFTVPHNTGERIAKGFLKDLDLAETGSRELTGEWVVGTDVWRRLRASRTRRSRSTNIKSPLGGGSSRRDAQSSVNTSEIGSEYEAKVKEKEKERVIYYIHGGAYYVGTAATHRLITIEVSKACNARVFAIEYRLAPENNFPLPLHDVLVGYLRLLAPPLSIPPGNIIIAGDSAGGGLSLALCMYLRDEGYEMPAGLVLMSPWVDLTMSCGSWDECLETDVVPRPEADDHLNPVGCYLGSTGMHYLTHPYASPLFGDLSNLPPMLIQSGDSEVLRDEVTLLAHKATLAGVHVTHELYEDMIHVFQMYSFLPAAGAAIASIGKWVRVVLPGIEMDEGVRVGVNAGEVESRIEGELDGKEGLLRRDRDAVTATPTKGSRMGLALDLNSDDAFEGRPSIDIDSLPSTSSRSGSPTPIASPSPSHNDLYTVPPPSAPRLRRALTEYTSSTNPSPSKPTAPRRRRRTQGASSISQSLKSLSPAQSYPVSPTLSVRMRLRSPTMSSLNGGSVISLPSTRMRSQSHSDIFHLVEGYVEGGAANETTVYSPGGEIKSVGVLGEDDEGED